MTQETRVSVLDTHPTSPDVVDPLEQLLEELDVAGGEIVITCRPGTMDSWRVQLLTDDQGADRPCRHGGIGRGRYLADAVDMAREELRQEQAVTR